MIDALNFAYLAPSLFAFYMTVACNFLPEIFGCRLQTLLRTSMIAKHITGLLLLFFLVIALRPESVDNSVFYNIGVTIGVYCWFFMTTRIPFIILVIILLLLISAYIMDLKKSRLSSDTDKKEIDNYKLWQIIITISILVLTFFGFIYYYNAKKDEYKDLFTINKFITGTLNCRNSDEYPVKYLNGNQ